jgi:hypothetical protein
VTRNAVGGIATFNDITLSAPGTGYTLVATSGGVANITSTTFDITGATGPNRTWAGTVSTDWFIAGNWTGGGVPTATDNAIIPAGPSNMPVLTNNAAVANLTIATGASLSMGNFNIGVGGNVDVPGGIVGQGLVAMTGTAVSVRGTMPNLSINGLVSVNGPLSVGGNVDVIPGATFTIGGNAASIGNLSDAGGILTIGAGATVNAGTLTITGTNGQFRQAGGTLTVAGVASFGGASTVGQITGGTLVLNGPFTQLSTVSASSFVASGSHRTIFAGGTQTATIASPATTRFQDLEIDGPGTLTLGASITANGQLISTAGANAITSSGATITAAGGNIDGLTLDNTLLVSNGGTLTRFDNVTFQNYSTSATPLTITHPGAATSFTFNNTQFLVTPTSGSYLSVTDANPSDGLVLTIDLLASTPPNGSAQTATSGGAVVNWLGTNAPIAWTNPSGGNWSTPSNWSLNRVPTATDSVVIALAGTYTIQLDTTFIAKSIVLGAASGTQTLVLDTRIITIGTILSIQPNGVFQVLNSSIGGAGSIDNNGTIDIRQVTVNTPVRNNGSMLVSATVAVTGAFTTTTNSAIHLLGNGTAGNAQFETSTSFTNNGVIDMASTGGGFSTFLSVVTGTFTNAGTFTTLSTGITGPRFIDASLNNQGAIVLNQTLTIQRSNATHVNNGSISLQAGDFTVSATGGTFTNSGNIATTAGRTFSMTNGTYTQTGGISGAGTASFTTVAVTFNNNITNATTNYTFVTSSVNGPGNFTNAAGRTMTMRSSSFASNMTFDNQGTLNADGNTPMNATFTMPAGSVLNLQGNATAGNAFFAIANAFTNNGTINMTSAGGGFTSQLAVTAGTFTNAAGGTVNSQVGAGGSRAINGVVDNQGSIVVDQALAFQRAGAAHVNSGTITVNGSATLTIAQTGTSPSFTNSGTVTLNATSNVNISGGTFNQSSAGLGGTGTLSLATLTANFSQPFTNASTNLTLSNTTLTGTTVTNAAGRTLSISGSTIATTGGFINNGTLITQGTNAINGSVTTAAGGIIRVFGNSSLGNATLTFAQGFTNNGGIEFTTSGGGFSTTLTVTSGTLTNASGGTITSLVGAGGPRNLNAQLDNQSGATVSVQQSMALNLTSGTLTNAGTVDIASGTLTVSQAGGTFTNASGGQIAIAAGGGFSVLNGTFTHASGATISGAGTLSLSGAAADFQTTFSVGTLNASASSTVNFQSAFTTTGMTTSFVNSTVTGQQTITNAASQSMTLTGTTISAVNGLSNAGTINVTGTSAINGSFSTAAGSLLSLQGNSAVGNATLTVANGFVNNGTIDQSTTGGGFTVTLNVTTGTLVNSSTGLIHTIVGNGGPRNVNAELDNNAGGTITLDQPLTINRASAQHVNGGLITVNATGGLTVTQTGTSPSFQNAGTIAVAPSASVSVSNGTFALLSTANLNGGGSFIMSGGTANFANSFTLGALNLSSVNATFANAVSTAGLAITFTNSVINGPSTFTNVAGQTMNLVGSNFAANAPIVNQGTILSTSGTVLNGAYTAAAGSTLRLQGNSAVGNATVTIANGFTNDGLIDMTTTGGGFTTTLNVSAGNLTNSSTGVITTTVGNGGPRILNAQLVNQAGGTVTIAQDLTMNRGSATYTNAGSINLTTGNLTLTQNAGFGLTNTGTITVGAGRTFTVSNGTFTQQSGATLNGGGGFTTTGGATTTLNSGFTLSNISVTASSTLTIGQSITLPSGTTMNVVNSTVNSSGNFNIANAAGATMSVRRSTVSVGIVSVTNSGLLVVEDSSNFGNTVANVGTVHIEGNSAAGNAKMQLASFINNSGGLVELANGTAGFVGTLSASTGVSNNAGATITAIGGNRSIIGNVTNAGTINMSSGASTGILTIFGNLSNSGTLNFRITQFGGVYDQLQVTGTLTLGVVTPSGTLNASLTTPFTPSPGTVYQLITNYTSSSGTIATYNLPAAGWTHNQGATLNIVAP